MSKSTVEYMRKKKKKDGELEEKLEENQNQNTEEINEYEK